MFSRQPLTTPARDSALKDRACEHYADIVERLLFEFEASLSLGDITGVVQQCRQDLAGSPPAAMPELLERLARCRLSTRVDDSGAAGG